MGQRVDPRQRQRRARKRTVQQIRAEPPPSAHGRGAVQEACGGVEANGHDEAEHGHDRGAHQAGEHVQLPDGQAQQNDCGRQQRPARGARQIPLEALPMASSCSDDLGFNHLCCWEEGQRECENEISSDSQLNRIRPAARCEASQDHVVLPVAVAIAIHRSKDLPRADKHEVRQITRRQYPSHVAGGIQGGHVGHHVVDGLA
mmetsp:Transcript_59680/g.193336  ORF Transcript_59680/g.193336 Transcript_59680/m.193336 type:complete len:202 (+) Transcript_59680:684-1289(+)